jgi:hypothetical protein
VKASKIELIPGQQDEVLKLPLFRVVPSEPMIFIGLPAITARRLYMLPVVRDPVDPHSLGENRRIRLAEEPNDASELTWIDYTVHWL